jgi:phosphoribosyl 1,2-cyclic phosphodiesterase
MKVKVIASGSKGNSTLVISDSTKILIDAGVNYKRIKDTLDNMNININELDGVLITHTHSDHIGGLSSLIKKVDIPVFIKEELYPEIKKIIPIENIVLVDENNITINTLDIEIFSISHDVAAFGFIINDDKNKIMYLTDTGYINRKYYERLKNLDACVIESNHDEKMLMEGPYPYILKQRVISDKGHLSNRYTGKFLNKVIGDRTKYIVLAHLSENNNTVELALSEVKDELKDNIYLNNITIMDAKQHIDTELVEV